MRRWGLLVALVVTLLIVAGATATAQRLSGSSSTTSTVPTSHTHVQAPAALFAEGTAGGSVVLSWEPAGPTPTGYRVYRAIGRHGWYQIIGSVNAADMDTYTDNSSLAPGTTYSYTVTAFDRTGESTPVGPVIAVVLLPRTPAPTPAPPAPIPTFVAPTHQRAAVRRKLSAALPAGANRRRAVLRIPSPAS